MSAFYSLSSDRRRELADRFVGLRARIVVARMRSKDLTEELVGRVVSVAIPNVGTIADVLVLRREGSWDVAISLATIVSIEEATA